MKQRNEQRNDPHTVDLRLGFFQDMVRCCFPVDFWEFDKDLSLQTPLLPEKELTYYFFKYGTAYRSLQDCMEKGDFAPALVHGHEGLYWMADFDLDEEKAGVRRVVIMGPFAMSDAAKQQIRKIFQSADHPFDVHRKLIAALDGIPMIPAAYLFQYAIMFHYALTGETIRVSDIHQPFVSSRKENIFAAEEEATSDPSKRHAGAWQAEQKLMQAIQTGNLDYSRILDHATMASSGVQTRDPGSLRSNKDSIILLIGLASRAAIAGGLPPEISYDMCDRYVDMVESAGSFSEAKHTADLLLDDYIRKVHQYQQDSPLSKPVRICCDYIHMHVSEELSFATLAKVCGYTEYYLSRKFKKETGVSLGEYILHAKLDQACLLLKTTTYPIQDISDSLAFSSRSYFSTAFQKYTGCSPTEYRENLQLSPDPLSHNSRLFRQFE